MAKSYDGGVDGLYNFYEWLLFRVLRPFMLLFYRRKMTATHLFESTKTSGITKIPLPKIARQKRNLFPAKVRLQWPSDALDGDRFYSEGVSILGVFIKVCSLGTAVGEIDVLLAIFANKITMLVQRCRVGYASTKSHQPLDDLVAMCLLKAQQW